VEGNNGRLPIINIVNRYWIQTNGGYMLEDQFTNAPWYRQRSHFLSCNDTFYHCKNATFGEKFGKLTMDWEDLTLPTMHAISINNCDSR
jgi:hypothetical protein